MPFSFVFYNCHIERTFREKTTAVGSQTGSRPFEIQERAISDYRFVNVSTKSPSQSYTAILLPVIIPV